MNGKYISLFGLGWVLFRIWITEYKLKCELGYSSRYYSRILNIYYGFALMMNFKNSLFNFIVACSSPAMGFALIHDVISIRILCHRYSKKDENFGWRLIERSTLHSPIFFTGFYWILKDFNYYIPRPEFSIFLSGILLTLLPFFMLDKRWVMRHKTPSGEITFLAILISSIAMFGYFYL